MPIVERASVLGGIVMRMLFAAACAVLVACSGSPTSPSQQGPLRLTAEITRIVIPSGETATITFRLQNLGARTLTLNFSDGCQLLPYIANASGVIVYPGGGGWGCTLALTSLTLPPGGAKTVDVQVRAGAQATYGYVALVAGEYSAYAKLKNEVYPLQSDPVRFTVQ